MGHQHGYYVATWPTQMFVVDASTRKVLTEVPSGTGRTRWRRDGSRGLHVLLLGVGPEDDGADPRRAAESQFDAAAAPMVDAFSTTPNLQPYAALLPRVSLWPKNTAKAPMAAASLNIDFSEPDRIPRALMNRILWRSARGARSPMSTVR